MTEEAENPIRHDVEDLSTGKKQVVAVFALGTVGDVLPVLILSRGLIDHSSSSGEIDIIFVTNDDHRAMVQSYFGGTITRSSDDGSGSDTGDRKFSVCYVQLPSLGLSSAEKESFFAMDELTDVCAKVGQMDNLSLVIANLFCLAGWLVAESRDVQCVLIHPHKPPTRRPADFRLSLKRHAPSFYRALCLAQQDEPPLGGLGREGSSVDWQDYDEWLWPTLSTMYDSTRLSLKLKHPYSPSYVLPMKPIVVLALSPRFHPPPGYWPADRYMIGGFISHHQLNEENIEVLSPDLSSFLEMQSCRTVCVDFGSMTQLILAECDLRIFHETLLHLSDFSFVILCHGFEHEIRTLFASYSSLHTALSSAREEAGGRIFYVNGRVSHDLLFRRCVAVLHHGGAGTLGACLLAGTPQVVMPLIQDQHQSAERLEYMGLSPPPMGRKVLFPTRRKSVNKNEEYAALIPDVCLVQNNHEARKTFSGLGDPQSVAANAPLRAESLDGLVRAAVTQLERRLQYVTTPMHRLRCACHGRDLRADGTEDGLRNSVHVVLAALRREQEKLMSTLLGVRRVERRDQRKGEGGGAEGGDDVCWQEFECGLLLATHRSAPEETAFLYSEIFEQRGYLQHGVVLAEGGLVIDVVFAELQYEFPDALKITAIEPLADNFRLLRENMGRYAPSATLVQAAISSLGRGRSEEKGTGGADITGNARGTLHEDRARGGPAEVASGETVAMTFFPRMPGNSCTSSLSRRKEEQHERLDRTDERSFLYGKKEEICNVKTLSQVIDEGGYSQRISLLKVDVEGSELDVLLSIDDRHWPLIDQIVVETGRPEGSSEDSLGATGDSTLRAVTLLLEGKGFGVTAEWDPSPGCDTGSVLVFAIRNRI